jgi:hypothetical protein
MRPGILAKEDCRIPRDLAHLDRAPERSGRQHAYAKFRESQLRPRDDTDHGSRITRRDARNENRYVDTGHYLVIYRAGGNFARATLAGIYPD